MSQKDLVGEKSGMGPKPGEQGPNRPTHTRPAVPPQPGKQEPNRPTRPQPAVPPQLGEQGPVRPTRTQLAVPPQPGERGPIRPTRTRPAVPPQTGHRRRRLLWLITGGIGGGVLLVTGIVYLATRPSAPAPASPAAPKPAPPSSGSIGKPKVDPPTAVDGILQEVDALVRDGKFKQALEKLNWFPARGCDEASAARLAAARADVQRRISDLIGTRAKEAEELAGKGKLRAAADRLQELADIEMPALVGAAYDRLRKAADVWLAAKRAESHAAVVRELDQIRARARAERAPADPEAAMKEAQRLVDAEKWSEAVEVLTALAAVPSWRDRALQLRAVAHYGAERFVDVLLDAQTLLESGAAGKETISLLNRAITRAPIDETVRCLYERLLDKDPAQPVLWTSLVMLHTWRHDTESAADAIKRARAKKVGFTMSDAALMDEFLSLRERGFPPGKPVVVDYAGPYEILTDAGPRRARELATLLDGIATEYGTGLPYARNANLRFRVMFFSNDFDFQAYTRSLMGRTARERGAVAFYTPSIKQLVVCDEPKEFKETVRHEAFHQWLDYSAHDAPRWFNEGSASYYEKAMMTRVELNEYYAAGAQLTLEKLPALKELILMPVDKWVTDEREPFFYCEAWSFIYWLRKTGRGALLDEYLRRLVLGDSQEAAYERVFSKRLDDLERPWKAAVATGQY